MRILKAFGMTMLVAVLVLGLAVVVIAESASSNVNVWFYIPSWISLSVTSGDYVNFGDIAEGGGGGHTALDTTDLRVLSTTSWAVTRAILWDSSIIPAGASQAVIETALETTYSNPSGTWGITTSTVSYALTFSDDELATYLPVGNYDLVIQYTATTD